MLRSRHADVGDVSSAVGQHLGVGGEHMGVSVEEHRTLGHGGQMGLVPQMAVGDVEGHAVGLHQGVVCQNGEVQHHLVHLAVAVATDGGYPLLETVEHGAGLGTVVLLRQRVPGAVVEEVSQEQNPVRRFPLQCSHQLGAEMGGPVDIRGDQQFHDDFSFAVTNFIHSPVYQFFLKIQLLPFSPQAAILLAVR